MFIVSDAASLDGLRGRLAVDESTFALQMALMTPGDLDLNFLSGHKLLATVTYIYPNIVRWRGWPFDVRLVEGALLTRWLTERGWSRGRLR